MEEEVIELYTYQQMIEFAKAYTRNFVNFIDVSKTELPAPAYTIKQGEAGEVFKNVLVELGFANYKPSQMTNSK